MEHESRAQSSGIPSGGEAYRHFVSRLFLMDEQKAMALVEDLRTKSRDNPDATLEGDGASFRVADFLGWWDGWMATCRSRHRADQAPAAEERVSTSDDFSEWAKSFAPEVLAYLEKRRIDRREVFEMAFAVAEGEAKVDLAIAYLQSTPS